MKALDEMKKILYITYCCPFETCTGTHQRSNVLFRALRNIGHVDVLYFEDNIHPIRGANYEIKHFGKLPESEKLTHTLIDAFTCLFSTNCINKKNKYCSNIYNKVIAENKYDFIVFRYIDNALACGVRKGNNVIVDVDDLPEQTFLSLADLNDESFFKKNYYKIRAKLARYYTNKILNNIHHSFLPNKKQIKRNNSSYLPNIPFPFFERSKKINKNDSFKMNMLFVGALNWYPNHVGLKHFIENIFTIIKKEIPNIELNIIGGGLPKEIEKEWKTIQGVNLKGFVEDINAEYESNQIVIAPIYHGSGTNIKVVEAMSKGKIVVASKHATRGFEDCLEDGKNILIAENDEEFASKIINALIGNIERNKIEISAKKCAQENFSYEVFAEHVAKALK